MRTWTNANSQPPEALAHKISFLSPVVLSDVLHVYCRYRSRKPCHLWPPSKQQFWGYQQVPGSLAICPWCPYEERSNLRGWLQASFWKQSLRDKHSSKTTLWMSEVLSNSLFSCGCKDAKALFTSVGLFLDSAKLSLSYCYERQRQKLKWEVRLDETNTFFTIRTVKQWNSLHPSWQVFKTRLDNAFSNSVWPLDWACFEEDWSREGPFQSNFSNMIPV